MKKLASVVLTASLVFPGLAYAAGDVSEVESNHPAASAQQVTVSGGTITVSGVLGNVSGAATDDLDYYTFYGQEGDVVTLDIDGGYGGQRSFDSVIAIFGPGPAFAMLRMNDDASPIDAGSTSTIDSRIEKFRLPATAYYTVGVSNYPRYFQNGGTVSNPTRITNGDYKLVISGVSEPILHINIDIKPGHNEYAPINPKSRGKIPVVLLSSTEFNATTVDTASLTFGATGKEASLAFCAPQGADFNGDGRLDLMCHFENQVAGFEVGDLEGVLRGKSADGRTVEGRGLLKVVPEKHLH